MSEEQRIKKIIKSVIDKQGYLHTVESNGKMIIVSHDEIKVSNIDWDEREA